MNKSEIKKYLQNIDDRLKEETRIISENNFPKRWYLKEAREAIAIVNDLINSHGVDIK